MRTYGTLKITGGENMVFDVEPHVAIRMTRLFREARIKDNGKIRIPGTDDNFVDVDWFLHRYPMEVIRQGTEDGRAWLARKAQTHKDRMEEVLDILSGDRDGAVQLISGSGSRA